MHFSLWKWSRLAFRNKYPFRLCAFFGPDSWQSLLCYAWWELAHKKTAFMMQYGALGNKCAQKQLRSETLITKYYWAINRTGDNCFWNRVCEGNCFRVHFRDNRYILDHILHVRVYYSIPTYMPLHYIVQLGSEEPTQIQIIWAPCKAPNILGAPIVCMDVYTYGRLARRLNLCVLILCGCFAPYQYTVERETDGN